MRTYTVKLVVWYSYPDTSTRSVKEIMNGVSEDGLRDIVTSVISTLKTVGYRSVSSSPHRIMMFGDHTGEKRVIVKHEIESRDEN